MADQDLKAIIDKAIAAGYSDEDIRLVVQEHQQRTAPTQKPSIFGRFMDYAGKMNGADEPVTEADRAAQRQASTDIAAGLAKGGANTAIGAGELAYNYLPFVAAISNRVNGQVNPGVFGAARREFATPTNDAQKLGFNTEQAAEYLIPAGAGDRLATSIATKLSPAGSAFARMAAHAPISAATNASVAKLQGGDATTAAELGAAAPIAAEAATGATRWLGRTAAPALVRSAVKPTVTEMKQQAGASVTGINAQADRLVNFILEHKIATPEQAQQIISDAEQAIQKHVAAAGNTPTDAPQRAQRYLDALASSASKQGLPSGDVATIRKAMSELIQESPLSETVMRPTTIPAPSGLVDASGRPVMVASHEPVRQLRTDVAPAEALDIARSSSRWGNRKQWGEMKGAETEASKAVERANRDAVKTALPETRPLFQRQGQAIQTKNVFDRMRFREANREPISPFDVTTAAIETSQGRPPVFAIGRAYLRNNKLKLGIWAKRLEEALSQDDVKATTDILARFGVGASVPQEQPAPVPSH